MLAFDALVPIGFASRYFAVVVAALLLLITGALSRVGRAGLVAAILIFGLNGLAVFRYLTHERGMVT